MVSMDVGSIDTEGSHHSAQIAECLVTLIEDDESVRTSLVYVLTKAGFTVKAFATPQDYLSVNPTAYCDCMLIDLDMPEINGLQLTRKLQEMGILYPFIVLTGYGTIQSAVDAMRLGASDFIEKPVQHTVLIDSITKAVAKRSSSIKEGPEVYRFDSRIQELTLRERQILEMVVDGVLTKQIASNLKISHKTVDVHRSHIMKKLGVTSVAQLVKKLMKP